MSEIFGFDEFIDVLEDLEENFKRESTKLLEQTGDIAVLEAKLRTPVDTGTLRRSIARGDVEDYEVEVGTSIEYAIFQEEGTRYMRGHHMVRNGATIAKKHFDSEAEKLFKKTMKGFSL